MCYKQIVKEGIKSILEEFWSLRDGDHSSAGLWNMNRFLSIKEANKIIPHRGSSLRKVMEVREWPRHIKKLGHMDDT